MKKHYLIMLFSFLTIWQTQAQISLTYEQHALKTGDIYQTQKAEYQDDLEGKTGENQVWDFSKIKCLGKEISELKETWDTPDGSKLSASNVSVYDPIDDYYFYFDVNSSSNEYKGLTSSQSIIEYEKPITKMIFPFTYGDSFEGDFKGTGTYAGVIQSNIKGDYQVEADAYGKIILPDNAIFENVLRIKTVNTFIEAMHCDHVTTTNTKYIWYSADFRYPILSVLISKKNSSRKGVSSKKEIYYNEKTLLKRTQTLAVSDKKEAKHNYKIYPNPYIENVNIKYSLSYNCNVTIDIYNTLGKKVATVVRDEAQTEGQHEYKFSASEHNLPSGTYYVRLQLGEENYLEKIIEAAN